MKPRKCVCGKKNSTGTHQNKVFSALCDDCNKRLCFLDKKVILKTATIEDYEELIKLTRHNMY